MTDKGIDYGMGQTNIDPETGIRFGVIPQNDVLQSWADKSELDYGPPTCPECGNDTLEIDGEGVPDLDDCPDGWRDDGRDYACLACQRSFDSDDAYGDEAQGATLNGEYKASADSEGDIFILSSPYYTRAAFCSPCAPGACHLREPIDNGERAYCFAPDWFDHVDGAEPAGHYQGKPTSCPYPVFRVSDNVCVYTPD